MYLLCRFTASTHCWMTCWNELKSTHPSMALFLIMRSNNSNT